MGPCASQLLRAIMEHRLDDRYPQLAQIRRMIEQGRYPEHAAKGRLRSVEALIDQLRDYPNWLHRAPSSETQLHPAGRPDIELGTLIESPNLRVGVHLEGPVFIVAVGRTGSGKTTLLRLLLKRVEEHNKTHPDEPVIIIYIDRKGGDYADMPARLPGAWLHFNVYEFLRLGLNPPEDVNPNVWINIVATSFCARTGLLAAWVTLANILRFLLAALNPVPSETMRWPDFQLILDVCRAAPETLFSSKAEYTKSLIQPLEGLVQGSGDLFRTFGGLDVERDVVRQRKNMILAIPMLNPPWIRQFITDLLISQALYGRIWRAERVDRTNLIFGLDESDQDVSQRAQDAFPDASSPLTICLKQGREFGIGACLGLSTLGGVSRMILANATYHCMFKLSDEASVGEAKKTLLLPRGAEAILPALRPGQCLFRQADGWAHAMLAKIEYVPPCRNAHPHYDTNPYVPAKRLDELSEVQEALARRVSEHNSRRLQRGRLQQPGLSDNQHKFLSAAALHPAVPAVRLWESIGKVAASTQLAVYRELAGRKLVGFEEVRAGKRNMMLVEVLPAGSELLGKEHAPIPGRGGLVHRTFAAWLMMLAEKRGIKARLEFEVRGTRHPVDVAWEELDRRWRAFEIISTCKDNVASHVRACLLDSDAISTVTFVVPLKKVQDEVIARLESDPSLAGVIERVDVQTITPVIEELWP